MEPLRHFENSKFGGVIFRRTSVQIRNEGGLWDEASGLYSPLGAILREQPLDATFPSGMSIQFAHLEHEKNIYDWQGSQIPFIGFDELTHFTERQFFYMLSRNRSTSGVPGYVRATCNPDSKSWVRRFIDWWIDPETGYAIPERCGVLRWFIRREDKIIWADSREALIEEYGPEEIPKSVTFISAKLQDNKILMAKDPSYLANLRALSRVERARLLDGNWNIEAKAGELFQKGWFEIVRALPNRLEIEASVRYWDRASTEVKEGETKDPDWTAGVKIHKARNGIFYIEHVARCRATPLNVQRLILNTAKQDRVGTTVGIEQDPGQAGVSDAQAYIRLLQGFSVEVRRVSADKVTRALPLSAQCEAGNVKLLEGDWNEDFLDELENFFTEGCKDDQVDAASGAFNLLTESNVGEWGDASSNNQARGTIAGKLSAENTW